jgi:hypothetical protein
MAANLCRFAANPCLSFLDEMEKLSLVPRGKLLANCRTVNTGQESKILVQFHGLKLLIHNPMAKIPHFSSSISD